MCYRPSDGLLEDGDEKMLGKWIENDIRQNKWIAASTVFFMSLSASLFILTALLMTQLISAIDTLMNHAILPDFMQMHTGEVDEISLNSFVENHPEVQDWQMARFLNLDNSQFVLGGHNMADSTQDNGLSVQGERFDFMLGMDGTLPEVLPGEVYVPICYRTKYHLAIGDEIIIKDEHLMIKGFIRDAQMNAMMASSKRFLVHPTDYERLSRLGQEEYLIEFLLQDGSSLNAFQTAYETEGLPSNGPAITRPLIRMINALSDGMMIFVIFLVSLVVLLISMLCIHFILSIQMERDRREIGLLKALGIGKRSIRHIYFTKYLMFSIVGALLGLLAAWGVQEPLVRQLRELYGGSQRGIETLFISLLVAFLTEGSLLLSILHSLKKMDRLSSLEALFQTQKSSKSQIQYVLIAAVMIACTFLMLVPNHLYHTLSDPSFVTYMGIGDSDIRIDIRQKDDLNERVAQIETVLKQDEQVEKFVVLQTSSYPALLSDGCQVNLMVEVGDHLIFPVQYLNGKAPVEKDEIALSYLNAKELGLSLGDTLALIVDDRTINYHVCGIYSDITNGGKTAKMSDRDDKMPVIWSVLYVLLEPSANQDNWIAHYQTMGVDVVNIDDYVQDTYAQTLGQLRLASLVIVCVGVLVIAVVVGLFSRLLVERNRYTISLCKALGFTNSACKRPYFMTGMAFALIGCVLGLVLSYFGGEALCGLVLRSFVAGGIHFVIDLQLTYLIIPFVTLGTAALAIFGGVNGIQQIKAYECCSGKE